MHPDYVDHLNRIFDLIESGQLPEGAVQRLAAMGHRVLYGHWQPPEDREWKCIGCGETWMGGPLEGADHTCKAPEIYQTNHLWTQRWQCVACKHEWDGKDGIRCPSCQACEHEWGFPDGAPCVRCGKDKDEWMEEHPPRQRVQGWVPGYYRDLLAKAQS